MSSPIEHKVYIDAIPEGRWFKSLSDELSEAELIKINSDEVPDFVDELTSYDVPDIILEKNGKPVLVLEKTGHVPTGKNPLQRVARMVKAAENGITGVFFVPYAAMKHGKYAGKCNANLRLIESLRKIGDYHETEMLIPPWPTDYDYELIQDGSENELLAKFLDQFLKNECNPEVPAAKEIKQKTEQETKRILQEHSKYSEPPRSVEIQSTEDYLSNLDGKASEEKIQDLGKTETVVATFDMSPSSCRRVDPYGGAQFVYDYLYCRDTKEKKIRRNLVLRIPRVEKKTWLEKNPYDEKRKSSLWYKCADALELRDDLLMNFEKYKKSNKVDKIE
ncbi:MAG: hypothetical protein ABEJ56_03310 [Candidatus Nanohaloarchaea archaeon]